MERKKEVKTKTGKARRVGADGQITVDDKVRQGSEGSKFGDFRILVALK